MMKGVCAYIQPDFVEELKLYEENMELGRAWGGMCSMWII